MGQMDRAGREVKYGELGIGRGEREGRSRRGGGVGREGVWAKDAGRVTRGVWAKDGVGTCHTGAKMLSTSPRNEVEFSRQLGAAPFAERARRGCRDTKAKEMKREGDVSRLEENCDSWGGMRIQ